MRDLYDHDRLEIWPLTSLNEADPTRPLVVLLHGLSGDITDMTNPMSKAIEYKAFDINWTPRDIDEGWHDFPPDPGFDVLEEFFDSAEDMEIINIDDLIDVLRDYIPTELIQLSPLLNPANPDWFGFFSSRRFPVIAYSQAGERAPIEDNAYPEFLSIMEEIHTNLLGTSSCRKIALVGHSRGGFIARKYVVEALFGDLPPVHETIVSERVRFLGTLNSPLFGTTLAELPAVLEGIGVLLLPFLGGVIVHELLNLFGLEDAYLNALDELRPTNQELVLINIKDLALLAAATADDAFDVLNLSLEGDDRIKRIRRASTSGNRPLLLRFFTPYFYDPLSYVPDPFSRRCVEDTLIPNPFDPIPSCFRHTRIAIELPFSPFFDDFSPPTFMDFARGLIGPIIDIPQEIHATRAETGHIGGDSLVTWISGVMPFSDHQLIALHHGHPLWNTQYKNHIFNHIPLSFCYPRISFRVGDNIVELIWERISNLSEVMVVRFEINSSTIPSPQLRSVSLPGNERLFYDLVKVRNPLRYLISYKNSSISDWAHELDDQAFREATEVGNLALLIKNIIEDEEQEYRSIKSRIASSRVLKSFLVFSVNNEDLLSDCINSNLEQIRNRLNVTNYSAEEDWLHMRLSSPFANSYKDNDHVPNKCLVAWVEFKKQPLGGGETVEIPGSTDNVSLRDGGFRIGFPGVTTYAEGCQHIFRLMAAYFDDNGETDEIKEILPITCAFFDPNPSCMTVGFSLTTMESPLFVKHDNGFLFVTAGGSPFRMWVVTTDENLNQTGSRFIQLRNPPMVLPAEGDVIECPIDDSNTPRLELHDLISARNEDYYFAIFRQPTLTTDFKVVSFNNQGNEVFSYLELPWATRVQAAVFSEPGDKLLLFPSSFTAINPQFAIIPIKNDRTLDTSNIEWYPIAISGLLPPSATSDQLFERIQVQDTLKRCVQKAEFLVSLTGYFQDEEISSSLYRIEIHDDGTYSYSHIHHSGYGQYDVTWSRVDFGSSKNAVFWLTPNQSIFTQGLYGQNLLQSIPECSLNLAIVPGFFGIMRFLEEYTFEFICKLLTPIPWGRDLCEPLGDPRFWMEFAKEPIIRGKIYEVLRSVRDLVYPMIQKKMDPKVVIKTKPNLVKQVERKLVQFLDYINAHNSKSLQKRFEKLEKSIGWKSPFDRARVLNSIVMKKMTIPDEYRKDSLRTFKSGKFWIPGSIIRDDSKEMKED
jgi:hypothetical protein